MKAEELIERVCQGDSPSDVLDEVVKVRKGTYLRPRKRRFGGRGPGVNAYTGKRKNPLARLKARRAARKGRVNRRRAQARFNRSAKGKSFHKRLGKLVARLRRH